MNYKLNREMGAVGFESRFGVGDAEVINDFDKVYPWSEIKETLPDENGNVWVKIPKFYTKYETDLDGVIRGRYVSRYKAGKEWHLNPIFIRGGKELPYIEISKYLISIASNGRAYSKSGDMPSRNLNVQDVRSVVELWENTDKNNEYSLMDIWTLQLLQDLFAVEYATNNCQSILSGYVYDNYSNGLLPNGLTDVRKDGEPLTKPQVKYHTGCLSETEISNGLGPMKYRYIENLWGNGQTFIDGINFIKNDIYVSVDPENNGNYETYEKINLKKLDKSGVIYQLSRDDKYHTCIPIALNNRGQYVNLFTTAKTDVRCSLYNGVSINSCGLWVYSASVPMSSTIPFGTFRMIRRPL